MRTYAIFGHCLRSEIDFPDLDLVEHETPRWTLRVSDEPIPVRAAELLGEEDIGGGTIARLYRSASEYRLAYDDDTGTFDVSRNGQEITWFPVPNPDIEMVRLHVIGRVLAAALHAGGMYCLHGSGVVVGDVAVGLVAPRFWGKSTLALCMAKAGGRLLSDDTLAIDPDEARPRVWPGVHSVRLWGDSVTQVGEDDPARGAPAFDVKRTLRSLPDVILAREPAPLAADYLLAPQDPGAIVSIANRVRVGAVPAALSLIGHAKIGALLGGSEAGQVFDAAVRLAARVPVYRLEFPRDFQSIQAVVAQLGEWHRAPERETVTA